jgi:hypothetical protein
MAETSKKKLCEVTKTLVEKFEILQILNRNGYNFNATSKETGVPISTLRHWNNKHGPSVVEALEKEVALNGDVIETMAVAEASYNQFMNKAILVKKKVLDRIDDLIKDEKKMRDLTEALKTLHIITNPEFGVSPGQSEDIFTRFLKEGPKALKQDGKEDDDLTDTGDSEE